MSLLNEIPEEYKVKIGENFYDNREPNIVKDMISKEWINIYNSDREYYTFYTIDKFVNNILFFKPSYTKEYPGEIIEINIQYDTTRHDRFERAAFLNQEQIDKFCEEFKFVKGKVKTNCYFYHTCLKYDREKPYHFNHTRRNVDVTEYLYHSKNISDKEKRTSEYKDLETKAFEYNEKYGMESRSFRVFEGLRYTFGIELETISGVFKTNEDLNRIKDLNMQSVHDGSLRDKDGSGPWGAEYVTGVLKGDSGLKHLHAITEVLNEKCTVDERTSVHVHIGSLKWNSEDIVFMYILGKMLETEIFSMMPQSRTDNEYCKLLPKLSASALNKLIKKKLSKEDYKKAIKSLYNSVFNHVGRAGVPSKDWNKKSGHPQGSHGGWDRNRDHRYSWLNFTNIIFNQRGSLDSKTIEFRCHSGTLSYKKIHNWIKICMGIVEYVHIGKKEIIKALSERENITLSDILIKVYPKTASTLINYIELRKDLFNSEFNQDIDYTKENLKIKNIKELCAL